MVILLSLSTCWTIVMICDSFDFSNSLTTEKRSVAFDGCKNASKANNSYGRKEKESQHGVCFEWVFLIISIYVYKIVSWVSRMNQMIVIYTVYRFEVLFFIQWPSSRIQISKYSWFNISLIEWVVSLSNKE